MVVLNSMIAVAARSCTIASVLEVFRSPALCVLIVIMMRPDERKRGKTDNECFEI
jgi:hypothetical protein